MDSEIGKSWNLLIFVIFFMKSTVISCQIFLVSNFRLNGQIPYVDVIYTSLKEDSLERALIRNMTKLYTNFAKYGYWLLLLLCTLTEIPYSHIILFCWTETLHQMPTQSASSNSKQIISITWKSQMMVSFPKQIRTEMISNSGIQYSATIAICGSKQSTPNSHRIHLLNRRLCFRLELVFQWRSEQFSSNFAE